MNKIIIIGLPRTGTTSISVALLEHGFKVAHTAFTQHAFTLADVISDAPCFCDYPQLDALFPGSTFIYLERSLELWLPSIQTLLTKMLPELQPDGYLHPVLKRSFNSTFKLNTTENPLSHEHLQQCYLEHRQAVQHYFANRDDCLHIDISQPNSLAILLNFLNIKPGQHTEFPHLNIGKQVDSWKAYKHPNKINPLSAGPLHRKFFDY